MLIYCANNSESMQALMSSDFLLSDPIISSTPYLAVNLSNNTYWSVRGTGCSFDLTYSELTEVLFQNMLVEFTEERLDMYIEMLWQERLNKMTLTPPNPKELNHET